MALGPDPVLVAEPLAVAIAGALVAVADPETEEVAAGAGTWSTIVYSM